MDKIAESLEGDIIEPDWLSEHVGVLPEDRVRIDPEVWAQVAGHIERREAMRADYQSFKKTPESRFLKKKEQGRLSLFYYKLLLKSHAKNNFLK